MFLTATNKIKYNIGFNKKNNNYEYENRKVLENIDYIIKYNNIDESAISKYIEYNNIKDFDYKSCDFINYGFRGIKIYMNSKNLIK